MSSVGEETVASGDCTSVGMGDSLVVGPVCSAVAVTALVGSVCSAVAVTALLLFGSGFSDLSMTLVMATPASATLQSHLANKTKYSTTEAEIGHRRDNLSY